QLGLYAAVSKIDEIVTTIKTSSDVETARTRLMAMEFPTSGDFSQLLLEADPDNPVGDIFMLSVVQADTILEMRLSRLTGIARDEVATKVRELSNQIRGYILILNDISVMNDVIRNEFEEVRTKFSSDRVTAISPYRSEEHTSELQSRENLVCRLLLEKKNKI